MTTTMTGTAPTARAPAPATAAATTATAAPLPAAAATTTTTTTISHSIPMAPRLRYSVDMLDGIIRSLRRALASQRRSNRTLAPDACDPDPGGRGRGCCTRAAGALRRERTLILSLEALSTARRQARSITDAARIPGTLSLTIPLVRAAGAMLFEAVPDCSRRLSELSVHLGSVALDSASLTRASLDFGRSSAESSALFAKLNLIADSKICEQYPNLDIPAVSSV